MDFESHSFGVKIAETDISVELIETMGEFSKYQFILSDKMSSSYNANTTYGIDILKLTTQENIEFFGWKLISLSFPGNWYGQWGVCELEDLYGMRNEIVATKQTWYHENRRELIEQSLDGAKKFAESNYSVDYFQLVDTVDLIVDRQKTTMFGVPSISIAGKHILLLPKANKICLKGFDKLITSTKQYIDNYKKVISSLSDKKDERSLLLIDKLKKHFSDILKKYYPFEIEDLSESK